MRKVGDHIRRNKKYYLVGAGCFAAGILIAGKAYQINYKSPGAANIFVEAPKRNMHPGYLVRDRKTGMTYPSIRATAKATGVDRNEITDQIKNLIDDRFEILGEARA